MRILLLTGLLGITLLSGCTRRYVLTLTNGSQITSQGKPKAYAGGYVIVDGNGQKVFVPAGRIREIEPASMAASSGAAEFRSTTKK